MLSFSANVNFSNQINGQAVYQVRNCPAHLPWFGLRGKSMLKKIAPFIILLASVAIAVAQTATSQTATAQQSPDPQQQQEEKAKLEKKAVALLEQVVTDSQGLRLPEIKIRVNIAAGDMLWDKNPARGRSLVTDA